MALVLDDPFGPSGGNLDWERTNATGEDNDRNTITQAFLGDLVAKPHGKHRTGEHNRDEVGITPEPLREAGGEFNVIVVLHGADDAVRLDSTE